MHLASIGRCSVFYSAGALRLGGFRLLRGGGQSYSRRALRALRPVLRSLLFLPLCRVHLRFFAPFLRGGNALKPTLGVASKAAGGRPSLWRPAGSQRRARGHIKHSVRAQAGWQSWQTACVLMPGGIHPQLNHAEASVINGSVNAAGTWRANALFKMRALH